MIIRTAFFSASAILIGLPCTIALASSTTMPSDTASVAASTGRLLRTEDFESGSMQLGQASTPQLEDFLRDLNRRKDFDFSSHGGQAGPNADYLAGWVTRVTNELISRGYWYNAHGDFLNVNDHVVAVR